MPDSEFEIETPAGRDQNPTPFATLVLVVLSIILIFSVGLLLSFWVQRRFSNPDLKAVVLSAELLLLIPELLYIGWKKLSFRKVFRLRPVSLQLLAASVVVTIGLVPLTDTLDRVLQNWIRMPAEMENLIKASFQFNNPLFFWIAFLSVTLFAGIFEEMLFRGFFQQVWERAFSPLPAIGISAILFAVVHFNPWWLIQILLLGILLGYIAYRSDSVVPGIFIHVLNNAIAFYFLRIPDQKMGWYLNNQAVRWYWLVFGLILFVTGFRWMLNLFGEVREWK